MGGRFNSRGSQWRRRQCSQPPDDLLPQNLCGSHRGLIRQASLVLTPYFSQATQCDKHTEERSRQWDQHPHRLIPPCISQEAKVPHQGAQ